jgi:salicylate synthetase
MSRTQSLAETRIPEGTDGNALLHAIAQQKIAKEYFLYASDVETRIAVGCRARVTVHDDTVSLEDGDGTRLRSEPARDPFAQVARFLESGGESFWTAYGHVSFDAARHYLPYAKRPEIPELVFTVPEAELIVRGNRVTIRDGVRVGALKELVESLKPLAVSGIAAPIVPEIDDALRPNYEAMVSELTGAIRCGELAKAILSRRVVLNGELDVPATFTTASRVNSAVRSFAFRSKHLAGVGFSPEVVLEADANGLVTTSLLAGTRRRGETPEDDARLRSELFSCAKEVKEHALSVHLAQAEIASVCSADSVRIFDFMSVKTFRTVQHLGSRVSGMLRSGRSGWDALRVLFPAITVAGIPKAEAVARIGALEGFPRGPYAGVTGIVDGDGRMDLTLSIRSAFEYGGRVYLQAGAGIVGESNPNFEYVESVNKMKMMLGQTVLTSSTRGFP